MLSARRSTPSFVEMLKPALQCACALTECQKHLLGAGLRWRAMIGSQPLLSCLSLLIWNFCLTKKRWEKHTQHLRKVRQIGSLQGVWQVPGLQRRKGAFISMPISSSGHQANDRARTGRPISGPAGELSRTGFRHGIVEMVGEWTSPRGWRGSSAFSRPGPP